MRRADEIRPSRPDPGNQLRRFHIAKAMSPLRYGGFGADFIVVQASPKLAEASFMGA